MTKSLVSGMLLLLRYVIITTFVSFSRTGISVISYYLLFIVSVYDIMGQIPSE